MNISRLIRDMTHQSRGIKQIAKLLHGTAPKHKQPKEKPPFEDAVFLKRYVG